MTIAEHQKNVQTFLQYDFVKGPSQGRLLLVSNDEKDQPILREVKISDLTFLEKIRIFFSDGIKLETIVQYVNNYLRAEAQDSKTYSPEQWKIQFAMLQKKVQRYNNSHWLSEIEFDNPLLDTLKIKVKIPRIPKLLSEDRTFKSFHLKVPYSPLTTFEKVEEVIKEKIGPDGFYSSNKASDREKIRKLSERKVIISSWLEHNPGTKLEISYDDINLDKYINYISEYYYTDGHFKGYASGLFQGRARTSRRAMMGFPELESDRVKSKDELYKKYS